MSFPTIDSYHTAGTPSFRDPSSPDHPTSPVQRVFSRSIATIPTNYSQPKETKPLNIPESPPPNKAFKNEGELVAISDSNDKRGHAGKGKEIGMFMFEQ
ncbi:MAG: hypothetical protein K940chlam7_01699 [Chlamydiae bacterium]|nr:hypothetical protein [Chlamydiota bacterium]